MEPIVGKLDERGRVPGDPTAPARPETFHVAARITLWLAGLFIALMTGTLSAYLVLTAGYLGSRIYAHLRREAWNRMTGG